MAYRYYQRGRRERLRESCERSHLYNTVSTEVRPQNNNAGTLQMQHLGHARIQRGGGVGGETSQKYRVSWQYWSGSPEQLQRCQANIKVGPSKARQRNAIYMAFCWRADDGRFIVVNLKTKKKSEFEKKVGPLLTKLSGSRYVGY